MLRLAIIVLSVLGAFGLLSHWPNTSTTVFTVADVAVTWVMLACVGVMLLTYKATK